MKFISVAVWAFLCLLTALSQDLWAASETNAACLSCHKGKPRGNVYPLLDEYKDSHKVGVKPADEMAQKALPLDRGNIACSTCHVDNWAKDHAKDQAKSKTFLRLPTSDSKLCLTCHNNTLGERSHPLHAISPTKEKVECISCHVPHGASDTHLLRASGAGMKLCRNCHVDKFPRTDNKRDDLSLGHIVMFEVDDETVKESILRSSGRLGEDGELICFSCHTLHNAEGQSLLISDNTESAFCRDCHGDKDGILTSSHNMEKNPRYRSASGKKASELGICTSCHGSHKWQLAAPKTEDKVTSLCLSCHSDGKLAAGRAISLAKFNHFTGDIGDGARLSQKFPQLPKLKENAQAFLDDVYRESIMPGAENIETLMTCLTCHDIHGEEKNFLREPAEDGSLCLKCHEEQQTILKTPHGNVQGLKKTCLNCHQIHNANMKDLVKNDLKKKDDKVDFVGNACFQCHKKGGVAEKRVPKFVNHSALFRMLGSKNAAFGENIMKNLEKWEGRVSADGNVNCVTCHEPHNRIAAEVQ
jgi:predicted CXXCH cytochrome family protein